MKREEPLHVGVKHNLPQTAFIMGNPERVKLLMKHLDNPMVLTKKRGYVIAEGSRNGRKILLASHGIGGPSLLILVEELRMLGVRRFIRIGSTGGFAENMAVGDIVVARAACMLPGSCGLSLYSPRIVPPLAASYSMVERAVKALKSSGLRVHVGNVFCSDSFYGESWDVFTEARKAGCISVDMETAALYGISAIRDLDSLSILAVSNVIKPDKEEFAEHGVLERVFSRVFSILVNHF